MIDPMDCNRVRCLVKQRCLLAVTRRMREGLFTQPLLLSHVLGDYEQAAVFFRKADSRDGNAQPFFAENYVNAV